MAKPAGFNINVQTMPHATYLDQVWKKGSFYVGFYNMQPTADAIFSLLYTSNAAWNETRWNNTAFDKLVAEARTTIDEAKRRELYAKAQKLMHDEVPSIIPVFFDLLAAQRDYVQGCNLHPRGAVFRLDLRLARRRARRSGAKGCRGQPRVTRDVDLSAEAVGADRLHALRGVAAGLRHHPGVAGRCGGDDAGGERNARALAASASAWGSTNPFMSSTGTGCAGVLRGRFRRLAAHRPAGGDR